MNSFEKMTASYDIKKWNERTMNIAENVSYYVYKHYLDGELFYIGKGQGLRCFEFKKRGAAWTNFVDGRENEILVDIVKVFESENEAFNFESNEIIQCESKSLVNVMHNKTTTKKRLNIKHENLFSRNNTHSKFFKVPTYIVYGSEFNDLDMSSLTTPEIKVLMSIVSQIKKSNMVDGQLSVKLSFSNVKYMSNNKHLEAKKVKKRISNLENIGLLKYELIDRTHFEVTFPKHITEKLLSNRKGYTVLNLREFMLLKNNYSIYMYMKLSENRMKGEFIIDKNNLLNLISPPASYNEYDLIRKVINKTLEENSEFFPNLAFSNILGNFLPDVCKFNFFKRRSTKMEKELAKADSNNVLELIEKYRY